MNRKVRHYPPTGKKCKIQALSESENSSEELQEDNPSISFNYGVKAQKDSVGKKKADGKSAQSAGGLNCKVKGTMVPRHSSASEQEEQPKGWQLCKGCPSADSTKIEESEQAAGCGGRVSGSRW